MAPRKKQQPPPPAKTVVSPMKTKWYRRWATWLKIVLPVISVVGTATYTYIVGQPEISVDNLKLAVPLRPNGPIIYNGVIKNHGSRTAQQFRDVGKFIMGPSSIPLYEPVFDEPDSRHRPVVDLAPSMDVPLWTPNKPYRTLYDFEYEAMVKGEYRMVVLLKVQYKDLYIIPRSKVLCYEYSLQLGTTNFGLCPYPR